MGNDLKKTRCPHCGEHDFRSVAFNPDKGSLYISLLYTQNQKACVGDPAGWRIPAYIKRCDKCGFIGLFYKNIVDKNGVL